VDFECGGDFRRIDVDADGHDVQPLQQQVRLQMLDLPQTIDSMGLDL
jgi:hypothetical protein